MESSRHDHPTLRIKAPRRRPVVVRRGRSLGTLLGILGLMIRSAQR